MSSEPQGSAGDYIPSNGTWLSCFPVCMAGQEPNHQIDNRENSAEEIYSSSDQDSDYGDNNMKGQDRRGSIQSWNTFTSNSSEKMKGLF